MVNEIPRRNVWTVIAILIVLLTATGVGIIEPSWIAGGLQGLFGLLGG